MERHRRSRTAQEAGVLGKDVKQREAAGEQAVVAACAAYDQASRLEADALRMSAAGAPERAHRDQAIGGVPAEILRLPRSSRTGESRGQG